MDISPLFVLRQRLHAAALAGAASCLGDVRLAQACEALAPLEAAAPVFRKLGDLVRRLRVPEGEGRAAVLLEALTLADALACTQAAVAVPGEVRPMEPAVSWGGVMADIPYSVLRQVRENLLCESYPAASFMKELMSARQEWRCDVRLCKELLRLMDAGYDQSARFWLTEQDKGLLPLLQGSFDPRGGEGMKYRVAAISKIAGADANDFYVSHLPAANEDIRCVLLKELHPTDENAELLVRLCHTETDPSCLGIICELLARTSLPSRWEHLRDLGESAPREVLHAMKGLSSPEASALTAELWAHILLPHYEATREHLMGDATLAQTLIGKSGPAIHDIYRRMAEVRMKWSYQRVVVEELAEVLSESLLELMDEGLLELAGELARTVSPIFAIPYLMGLMTMRSTGAAYDAACELLGPEGFGHGKLSEIALRVLADLFSCAHSDDRRESLTKKIHNEDWPNVDVDDLDKIATSPCNIFWSFRSQLWERNERPFADALDPRWLDAMLLDDPFAAFLPSSCWRAAHFAQKTLADIVFCLADLQDPPTRERLGAFFHEQALRGLEWGYRVMLWLRCCGRSDYQGIMEADLRRKKKDRLYDISFAHYYRSFLALDDPLGFAEEAERCLRLIRDKEIPSPGRDAVKMLEELFVEARLKAASRGGEDEADACNDAETE